MNALDCIRRILRAKNSRLGGLLSTSELEDLAQDVTLNVWWRRKEFRGQARPETWIFPFCYYGLMNWIRKRRGQPSNLDRREALSVPARQERDYQAVHRELNRLPETERRIVQARYLEGREFKQIARDLGLTKSTVKHRCYRGLERLRERLSRMPEG